MNLKLMMTFLITLGLLLSLGCQPTNTTVGKSLSKGGTANTSGLQQVRLTDTKGQLLTGSQLSLPVGNTLSLKAALLTLDGATVGPASVRWSLRSVQGQISSGLSCGATITDTCDFSPTTPGSVYLEITIPERTSIIVSPNDTSPLVLITAPSTPTQLLIDSGQGQSGLVDTQLGQPLKVKVLDAFNRGVPGVNVNFAVTGGGGSLVTPMPTTTDSDGVATAVVKLGTLVGSSNQLFTATLESNTSLTQTLSASALPGAVSTLVLQTPPLATYALLPFTQQPVVEAKDAFNNTVTTLHGPIVVSVGTGNGTLTGNTTKNFIAGSVTFTDLAYSISETGVKLRFTSGAVTVDSAPLSFTLPTGVGGITPADVNFGFKVVYNAGALGRATSDAVTVGSLSQPISVSVSGSGQPRLRLNGGAEADALYNVVNNDTLMVVADAPASPGVNVINIHMGGRTETFEVRYIDSSKVSYAFVSSSGGFGANIASDSDCTAIASAAGYQGTWKAMLATTTLSMKEAIPSQWGQLRRIDGQLIAASWDQLWTGPLSHAISITELGQSSTSTVWTGVADTTTTASATGFNCNNWTSNGGSDAGYIGSSTATSSQWMKNISTGCGYSQAIYCLSDPTALQDTNPNDVRLNGLVTTVSGDRLNSSTITVSGVTTWIPVSVSAISGNARLKINGGAEVTTGTVGNGDQIVIVMSAPTILSQKNIATLYYGDDTVTWWVGYADSSKVAAVFVSSTNTDGGMGGVGGANNICQAAATAQGYDGTWKALLTTSSIGLRDNMPWSWGQLRRMDGAVVATSWEDLWDGAILAPINLTEALVTKNSYVWVGGSSTSCSNFVSNGGGGSSTTTGDSSASTSSWLSFTTSNCQNTLPIYCVSDPAGTNDTTPLPISLPTKVAYTSGASVDSNEVIVLGITSPMTVTLTGSQGSPVLKINGSPAAGNTSTVNFGDRIVISMTGPTVLGTQHTATLIYGPDIYTFKVGYADSSKTARVFVTSKLYGIASGISAYDTYCTSDADAAGLGGTWKAILSADTVNAADRVPWNWGTLKLTDNTTIVANSWSDLWDGSIVHAIDQDEFQNSNLVYTVATGTKTDGSKSKVNSLNWTTGASYTRGLSNFINSSWIEDFNIGSNFSTHFYCMEDPSAPPDTTPTAFQLEYKIFQDTGVSVCSATYIVKGITAGSVPLVLTDFNGGAGNPTYAINGGAATPAGTLGYVAQGDSVVLNINSPASLNSSHKVTLKIGDADAVPFRVWTKGVTSGTLPKRIFVSDANSPGAFGGIAGADSICQTEATNAGRGGTWKALLSGEATDENSWAINRVGYQWTDLWTMDASGNLNQKVLSAPNLWNNSTLESLPNRDESGALITTYLGPVTNTTLYGFGKFSGDLTCQSWTSLFGSGISLGQIAGSLSNSIWIDSNSTNYCNAAVRLYCIEQ